MVQQKPDGTAHELGSSGQSDRSRSPVPIVNSDSTRSTWPVQRCHIQPDSHWCRYPHDKAIRSTLGNTANVKNVSGRIRKSGQRREDVKLLIMFFPFFVSLFFFSLPVE